MRMASNGKGKNNSNKFSQRDLSNEDDAYDAIFNGEFGPLEIGNYINSKTQVTETEHLPDAIDFEDEDELADEEFPNEESSTNVRGNEYLTLMDHVVTIGDHEQEFEANNALFLGMDRHDHRLIDDHGGYSEFNEEQHQLEEQQKQRDKERMEQEEIALLKSYFPQLQPNKILKMTKIAPKPLANYHWRKDMVVKPVKPLIPLRLKFEVQQDTKKLFKAKGKIWGSMDSILKKKQRGIVNVNYDEICPDNNRDSEKRTKDDVISEDISVVTGEWNYKKIVGDLEEDHEKEYSRGLLLRNHLENNPKDWEWNEDNLIDGRLDYSKFSLDINDEQLLFMKETSKSVLESPEKLKRIIPCNEKSLLNKFNVSNDEKYKILKENYQTKIRSTISNLSIEHSQPASILQSPFYKVMLPKEQLRYFHRNHFGKNIRPGTNIVFSKLKNRKRKRDKGRDIKEIFAQSSDLTLGDNSSVFLVEYSEQQPAALSKFGMASKLINYYRKTHEKDTSRPKLPVGETYVLGMQDKSPFWNFGFVEPGNIVPTLYNNMIRAPAFKHDVSKTDFLLVKSRGNGSGTKFYLRHINHLFLIGQLFPVVEIPGPNSRKVTSMSKNRLRMVVYRILNKSPENRLLVKHVAKHFPDQNDMQNRQRLKEFMKYQREGDDHGFWKLKDGEVLLDNENVKKMISPEDVSLTESMYSGQQYHDDSSMFNFDEKLHRLEENLIPWNASKNFLNATQMRAMIQIHGPGDPTGCGEGFSFLKTSMKGGFTKSGENGQPQAVGGHSYNVAQQQKAYEEEISKTWYTQAKSLRITNPFEELDDPDIVNKTNKKVKCYRDDEKVLKITRKKRDENGIIQRHILIVRDPRIIYAYLKAYDKKREEAENNLGIEELMNDNIDLVSGENDEQKQLKQKKLLEEQLAKLEKSKERRQARKAAKEKNKSGKVNKVKNTTRRCATCGAIGHIRTNKSCPMYNGGVTANAAVIAANIAMNTKNDTE